MQRAGHNCNLFDHPLAQNAINSTPIVIAAPAIVSPWLRACRKHLAILNCANLTRRCSRIPAGSAASEFFRPLTREAPPGPGSEQVDHGERARCRRQRATAAISSAWSAASSRSSQLAGSSGVGPHSLPHCAFAKKELGIARCTAGGRKRRSCTVRRSAASVPAPEGRPIGRRGGAALALLTVAGARSGTGGA